MLKLAMYLLDEFENGDRKTLVAREMEIPRTIDLIQLPEISAYLGTEILTKDLLPDVKEDIVNAILLKMGNYRSLSETIPAINPDEVAAILSGTFIEGNAE